MILIRLTGLFLLTINVLKGQETTVIDRKGTVKTITSNSFTVSATAPNTASAVEADLWYNHTARGENSLSVFESDNNRWESIELNTYLGYETFHHSDVATLQVTSVLNNMDIHIEDSGGASIQNTDVSDRSHFYFTNTTDDDTTLAFTGFQGVFIRHGGQTSDLNQFTTPTPQNPNGISATVTLVANVRYEVNITGIPGGGGGGQFANITYSTTPIYKGDVSDLTQFTFKTANNNNDIGTLAYNRNTTNGPGMIYWTGTEWIKLDGHNTVTNEILIEDIANNHIYVSMLLNSQWKVVRYNINDFNTEAEANQANNPSRTTQPTTLAEFRALSY